MKFLPALLAIAALVYPASVWGQEVLFQTGFDSDAGMIGLQSSDDTEFEFNYDYIDFDGIPEAPSSGLIADGEANRGLKLQANIDDGEVSFVAVSTENLNLTGKYEVQVDAWLNYNFPAGASGTTEFGGLSVGHDGEFAGLSGASLWYNTDGDSSLADYRLYKNDEFQSFDTQQYSDDIEGLNAEEEPFLSMFPSIDIGATVEQLVEGETPAGSGGFRWMTIKATVDPDAIGVSGDSDNPGIATFTITDESSGNTIELGTIDNSSVTEPDPSSNDVVSLEGEVAVVFGDIFTSVSNDFDLSFGVFDNLIVTRIADVSDPLDCSGDGSVTGADTACATAETIAATLEAAGFLAGDLDLNGTVDFTDFLTLSGNFGNPDQGGVYANGDVDLDSEVGFSDFLSLSGNFGKTAGGAESVPEPSGFALVCLGMLLIGRTRIRR